MSHIYFNYLLLPLCLYFVLESFYSSTHLPAPLCLTEYAHFVEGMFEQAQTMNIQFQTLKFQQFDRIVYSVIIAIMELSLSCFLLILGIN